MTEKEKIIDIISDLIKDENDNLYIKDITKNVSISFNDPRVMEHTIVIKYKTLKNGNGKQI